MLVMLLTWVNFGGISLDEYFFKSKLICGKHIIGMVRPIDVKKGNASDGYWANCVTSTFYPTHDIDLPALALDFHSQILK